jgi:hypothetical protein
MKNHLEPHRTLLAKAASTGLPDRIDRKSDIPIAVLQELVEDGYVNAVNAQSFDGPCFLQARITVSGREYLNVLDERHEAASLKGRSKKYLLLIIGWLAGVASSIAVALVTKFL